MRASGLIDDAGNMVALDVSEDGKSADLYELAGRINNNAAVGKITVNGVEVSAKQILELSNMKAALELAQLLEEEIEVTDDHVDNLESLLTGIADGSVDLDRAIRNGKLDLAGVGAAADDPAGVGAAADDLAATGSDNDLLTLNADGTGYVGPYISGSVYEPEHVFPFLDQDWENKEHYYINGDYCAGYTNTGKTNSSENIDKPLTQYLDWDNLSWAWMRATASRPLRL